MAIDQLHDNQEVTELDIDSHHLDTQNVDSHNSDTQNVDSHNMWGTESWAVGPTQKATTIEWNNQDVTDLVIVDTGNIATEDINTGGTDTDDTCCCLETR
ncbi:hypothetical protein HDU78_008709 [Chytriomyces hyalinus]|nr:hypothetical protein HDU78_008709 [Chytriomyces hyalinus]